MKLFVLLFALVISPGLAVLGADTTWYRPITITIFSNATAMPASTVAKPASMHPGVTVGTELRLNNSVNNNWFQSARLGYFYHQYSQHASFAITENGYRHIFSRGLILGAAAGLGMIISKSNVQVFKLQDNGTYKKSSSWRLQYMASVSARVGWNFLLPSGAPLAIFIDYQTWFQMPFVKQYILLLPNVSTHAGISIPLQ